MLVKSPGIAGEHPFVVEARSRAIPIWSEVELGYRLLPNPILGVTGTNGKTTTAEWLGAIFRAAGRAVVLAEVRERAGQQVLVGADDQHGRHQERKKRK